jgi:type IV secretory pathway TrbD component
MSRDPVQRSWPILNGQRSFAGTIDPGITTRGSDVATTRATKKAATNVTRIAVIGLGLACGALALALWFDAGADDLSGWEVLLGAVAVALIVVGAAVTPRQARPVIRHSRRRR